jgi:hypothetical protein
VWQLVFGYLIPGEVVVLFLVLPELWSRARLENSVVADWITRLFLVLVYVIEFRGVVRPKSMKGDTPFWPRAGGSSKIGQSDLHRLYLVSLIGKSILLVVVWWWALAIFVPFLNGWVASIAMGHGLLFGVGSLITTPGEAHESR